MVGLGPGEEDPVHAFEMVRGELGAYGSDLLSRDFLVALNKSDLLDEDDMTRITARFERETGIEPIVISAVAGDGLSMLVGRLYGLVKTHREKGS